MKLPNKETPYTLNELYEAIHEAGATVIESTMMKELSTPTYADGQWLPKQNNKPQPDTFRIIVEVAHTRALYRIEGWRSVVDRYMITRIIELSLGNK